MKKKEILSLVIVAVWFFLSLCLTGQMVQAGPPKTAAKIQTGKLQLANISVISPASYSKWVVGDKMKIVWKVSDQTVMNIDKYRLELLDANGKLIKTIAGESGGISFTGAQPYSYQWNITKDIPTGQYMVKVSCVSSQGFHSKSGLFEIKNPNPIYVAEKGPRASVKPVKITSFKIIAINPSYKGGILDTLDVEALIDASSDFTFGPRNAGPISVEPSVSVWLVHVKPGSSMDSGTNKEAMSKTFNYYSTDMKIGKSPSGGHYQASFFIYKSGLSVPYLSPIRVNGFVYHNGVQTTCSINWEFHGRVTVCLEGNFPAHWQDCKQIGFVNPGPPSQQIWVNSYPWDPYCTP
jgi:hypothetical protein